VTIDIQLTFSALVAIAILFALGYRLGTLNERVKWHEYRERIMMEDEPGDPDGGEEVTPMRLVEEEKAA